MSLRSRFALPREEMLATLPSLDSQVAETREHLALLDEQRLERLRQAKLAGEGKKKKKRKGPTGKASGAGV